MLAFVKKLTSILFLLLIVCTTLCSTASSLGTFYELITETEETGKETKEEKKESKEFTSNAHKKPYWCNAVTGTNKAYYVFILPQHTIDKQTQPPDTTC